MFATREEAEAKVREIKGDKRGLLTVHENCNCDDNVTDVSKEILWHCPVHGNCWNGIKNIKGY